MKRRTRGSVVICVCAKTPTVPGMAAESSHPFWNWKINVPDPPHRDVVADHVAAVFEKRQVVGDVHVGPAVGKGASGGVVVLVGHVRDRTRRLVAEDLQVKTRVRSSRETSQPVGAGEPRDVNHVARESHEGG